MSEQLSIDEIAATVHNHPMHDEERARIREAILRDGREHDGWVDSNRVREALSNADGLTVFPKLLAATYNVLRAEGLLVRPKFGPDDPFDPQWWVRSRDTRGRNVGKWMPRYRLRDYAA